MAVIPPDAGIQLRTQTGATLEPIAPVKDVGIDLPALQTGQAFSARILEALPDNLFRALVAGKTVTLSLPEGAKSGDTMELVVIDRTANLIVARQTGEAAGTATLPPAQTTLSPAGQLIAKLLLPEGEAPQSAALTRGQPLLAAPPQDAAKLAAELGKAVNQSGLFYEAHQAQWIAGRLPLATLLQEPQAQLPTVPGTAPQTAPPATNAAAATVVTETAGQPAAPSHQEAQTSTSVGTSSPQSPAPSVPEELRPLVQQQLDAVATQRLAWHGEVWPNQTMDWEIRWERPPREGTGGDAEPEPSWSTALRLTLPRLGDLDASLHLAAGGVRVTLSTPFGATAADLRRGGADLAAALQAAGVPLLGLQVKHEE